MQIVWSELALSDLDMTLEYGVVTFGEHAAERFNNNLLDNEKRLMVNPRMGRTETLWVGQPKNFRSLVVHQHYKLLYYIEAGTIYIAALFDTRRDLASLADRLK